MGFRLHAECFVDLRYMEAWAGIQEEERRKKKEERRKKTEV